MEGGQPMSDKGAVNSAEQPQQLFMPSCDACPHK
jgi:hypothetical protein